VRATPSSSAPPPASSSSRSAKSATATPMARQAEASDGRALRRASPRAPRLGGHRTAKQVAGRGSRRVLAQWLRCNPTPLRATRPLRSIGPLPPAPPRWNSLSASVTTGATPLLRFNF
jgi:hypothetical protein